MARESSAIIGSGINPLKKNVCAHPITGEAHLRGTQVVLVNPEDGSAGCDGAVTAITVGTSAVKIPTTPLKYRRAMSICNFSSTATIYIGFSSSVTTGTGWPLPPKTSLPLEINGELEVYAVSDEASTDVRVLELA